MTWGIVKNPGEACVFCTVLVRGAKLPLQLQYKIHKPPQSFWHSLKSFQLQSQFQFQLKFQNKKIKKIFYFSQAYMDIGLHSELADIWLSLPNVLSFSLFPESVSEGFSLCGVIGPGRSCVCGFTAPQPNPTTVASFFPSPQSWKNPSNWKFYM